MLLLRWLVRGAAASAVAAAIGACAGDTTILLRVTRDDTVGPAVPRVHLAIGVRAPSDVLAPASTDAAGTTIPAFVDDTAPGELIDTGAGDLKTAPYEVLLRPSQAFTMDTGLEVAAVAFDGDAADKQVIGFGAIGREIHFHAGESVLYEVTLGGAGAPAVDGARRDCGVIAAGGASIFACKPGCVRFPADGGAVWIGAHDDVDCDGDAHGDDCDDYDWTVNHRATDVCNNGKNDDCTGGIDDGVDRDGDGLTPCQGDCVDNPNVAGSKAIHPGAVDDPHDGVDNNCSGACDETDDVDADTYTRTGFRTTTPNPIDRACATAAPDCNDAVATIHPGATEVDGNGFDDDCDGTCDVDADGDGYTAGNGQVGVKQPPAAGTAQCAPSVADCDDDPAQPRNGTPAAQINPGAIEICDGVDDNCNGRCDEGLDPDADHFTVCGTVDASGTTCTYVGSATCPGNGAACDCAEGKPSIYPGAPGPELCDGYDEGCDGVRFPQDSPCFGLDAMNACKVGSRTCDDQTPPGGFGACVLTGDPAPPGACTAFGQCKDDPDPIACIGNALGATTLGCQATLDATQTPVDMCPVPPASYVVLLPAVGGTTACDAESWFLVGGQQHGAWKLGLADPAGGGGVGPTVDGVCQVDFVVDKVRGPAGSTAAPAPTSVLVIAHRGAMATAVVIDLSALLSPTCPQGPALVCHVTAG